MTLKFLRAAFVLASLTLTACSYFGGGAPAEEEEVASSSEQSSSLLSEEELVTRNVAYTGILEEGGVTIYQEGSYRLMLADGKMVLLTAAESTEVPLGLYTGKLVEVKGDVRPTVEAGGTLMEVASIEWIRRETDAEGNETEVRRILCGGDATCPTGFTCRVEETAGICVPAGGESEGSESSESASSESAEAASSADTSSASSASSLSQATPPVSESSSSSSASAAVSATGDVSVMAQEDLAMSRWTQQYCSTHIGFCIPVHKNWYFKSFGATSSTLWHVEIGTKTIENMGEGPLVIELKTGDISSLGVTDGAVTEAGGKAIGYRAWSDNRHFEISGDASLKEAVSVVTAGLKAGAN